MLLHPTKMLEYWMASNGTNYNASETAIQAVLQNPGSVILFVGYPKWLLQFAAYCCVLFMLVGIPGNLFTIAALSRTKKLKNATAMFIMNLAISDLMFCCFNLPLAASTFWNSSWRHGPLLCRLFPLLRYGLVAVSLFTILAITVNRYVIIGHPRLYPTLYNRKYMLPMIFATWITAFGILIVTWFGKWGRFGLDPEIGSCSILPDVSGRSPKQFLFIVAFLIPCIAIVICYARILFIVRKTTSKSRVRIKPSDNAADKVGQEQRSTSPRNQEEELSVLGSNLLANVSYASPLQNHAINPILNSDESCHFSPRLVIENPSLGNHSTCEGSRGNEEQNATEVNEVEKSSVDEASVCQPMEGREILEIKGESSINWEGKMDDMIFVDRREDSDGKGSEIFLDKARSKRRATIEKSTANTPLKHERITSRASFIVESALWLQKMTTVENNRLKRIDTFASLRSDEERPVKKAAKAIRRESRFRSVRKRKNSEVPRMSNKDRKLVKMILVIFSSFLVCYLPITITKIFRDSIDWRGLNIAGYILIYLTTCINPVIYVVMSSEYRSAYKNVLLCKK